MDKIKKKLEAIVLSVRLTGENFLLTHTPVVDFSLRYDSGKKSSIKIPMSVSNPFEMKLIEKELVRQRVLYEKIAEEYVNCFNKKCYEFTDKITVKSGLFKGIKYEFAKYE